MIIFFVFLLGLFLFDTFSNKEKIQKHPRTNTLESILESSHSSLYGFWESNGTYLMISSNAGKPNIKEYITNKTENNLGTLDIYRNSENNFKAKFDESKEKLELTLNEEKNELTLTYPGEEPIIYKATQQIPTDYTSEN